MSRLIWTSDHHFTVDGVAYRVADPYPEPGAERRPDEMVILKPRSMIEGYEALVASRPKAILELGIFAGGSTALLAQISGAERLVALDFISKPCQPLEQLIADHDLADRVRTFYGIDQANTDQLDRVVAEGFDGPIDLVIDDASHLEAQTRASFNRLFPHLRPGGAYVIEDWSWPHHRLPHHDPSYKDVTPVSALVCELVLASACRPQVVSQVVVDDHWALVRRGPRDLSPDTFDISALFDPVGADMVARMSGARTLTG